jgi:predicted MFS family arabinose efflux permease
VSPLNRQLANLAFANFTAGTGILIVAGMLNELAADLDTSVAMAGQLFTASSLAICFGAPLLAGLTTRIDRRVLLTAALALFALLNLAAAMAPGYAMLAVARVAIGLCVAIVTPQAAAIAGMLAPPAERGRALSMVFLGFAISTVAGVPLGAYLGATLGWRITFALVGALGFIAAAAIWFLLPAGLQVAKMDRKAWRDLAGSAAILLVIATTVVQGTGQFVLYSYIAPVLREFLAATPVMISLLLLWSGVCSVAGNIIAGRLIDRLHPPRIIYAALAAMLAAFLMWPATRGSFALMMLALMLWGFGCFAINISQQARLVALAPQLTSASIALNSSGIYLGQALGAMGGALVIGEAGLGALSWAGAIFLAAAIGVSMLAGKAGAAVRPK